MIATEKGIEMLEYHHRSTMNTTNRYTVNPQHLKALTDALTRRNDFTTSTMQGENVREGFIEFGWLPTVFHEEVCMATYLVRTHLAGDSPIAWVDRTGQWTMPSIRFNQDTVTIQNIVRIALETMGVNIHD